MKNSSCCHDFDPIAQYTAHSSKNWFRWLFQGMTWDKKQRPNMATFASEDEGVYGGTGS
jgi:hypothetical protein